MIDLRDIAKAFGCNVSVLANTMGYTRQGLHTALKTGEVQKTRMRAALEHLRTIDELQYQEDMAAAEEQSKVRQQSIRDMEMIFNLNQGAVRDSECAINGGRELKLYVVTTDTYEDGYGCDIELLRVADNKDDALISVGYAERQGWVPKISIVEINKPTRKYLGGYME